MNPLLLGDPSPSLRWRAAVELDGAGEDDAEVTAWRAEVDRSDAIAALVARLAAAARRQPQTAGYLLCQLAYLGYCGPAVTDAVEGIFDSQQPDGSWPVVSGDTTSVPAPAPTLRRERSHAPPARPGGDTPMPAPKAKRRRGQAPPARPGVDAPMPAPKAKRRRGQAPPALPAAESYRMVTMKTVLPLRGIAAAGFATDARAERAYDWLVDQRLDDGSWTGSHKADLGLDGRSSGEDPPYRKLSPGEGDRSATTGAVACFALHPERNRSEAARVGVEHLLAQHTHHAASIGWEVSRLVGLERASGVFTFYVTIDPAFLLDLASRCGFSSDHRRVRELVTFVERGRGAHGLWQHPVHPQLSRWLTFDLESSLRRLAGGP